MASPRTCIRNVRGFTLLEVLIVLGLIVIVGGFGLIVSFDSYRGFHFHNERDIIVSVLQKARSQAINNMCFGSTCTGGKMHGVHFDNAGNYIIFQGAQYTGRSAVDTAVDEPIEQKDFAVTISGANDVVFDRLSGNVAATAVVTVVDGYGHVSAITIEPTGRVWWTN